MEEITKSLIFAILLIVVMYTFGIIAYHNLEGWGWVDCLYFMSATFTTLGYGDVVPTTDEAKIFTVFFMWAGISIGFYLIYTISKYREQKIDHKLLPFIAHLMDRGHKSKQKRYPLTKVDTMPSDLKQIINPARPTQKKKAHQHRRIPPLHSAKKRYKK